MVRTCPDFGPFLYLPTHTRSCYRCSYPRPEYGLARVADVCLHFGPKQKDIISHPVIYNIEPPRYRFVDITQAKAVGMQLHGSRKEMERAYKARLKRREKMNNVGFNNGKGNNAKGSTPDTLDGGQFLYPWS